MSNKELTPKMMVRRAEALMYKSDNAWEHREEIFKLLQK